MRRERSARSRSPRRSAKSRFPRRPQWPRRRSRRRPGGPSACGWWESTPWSCGWRSWWPGATGWGAGKAFRSSSPARPRRSSEGAHRRAAAGLRPGGDRGDPGGGSGAAARSGAGALPLQHLRPSAPGRPHPGAAQGGSGEGDPRAHRQDRHAVRSRADHRRALALPPAHPDPHRDRSADRRGPRRLSRPRDQRGHPRHPLPAAGARSWRPSSPSCRPI